MKKLILPIALLLAGWCLTGAWYLSRNVCNFTAAPISKVTAPVKKVIAPVKKVTAAPVSKVAAAPVARLLKPLNVYFQSGQNTIIENDDLRGYLSELKKYTASNSNARVTITGHTDNQGNANQNTKLGQQRADFIRSYLVQKGYNNDIFTTDSKGPTAPIANNGTPEGRASNRRVEIRLNR